METKLIKTVTVEVLQRGSAALTQAMAEARAVEDHPGGRAVASRFSYARAAHARARGTRWVGVEVDVELTVLAD